MPPVLHREYVLDIVSLSSSGDGIAKANGFALFVNGAVPGDKVRAVVTKLNKNYGFAKLVDVIEPSCDRVAPTCEHFFECGGCQLMCMSYSAQCEFKRKLIKDALYRIGGIDCEPDFFGAASEYRYRNKMVFPFSADGEWGFYRSASHDVIHLKDCLLGDELNPKILDCIKNFFHSENIPSYNEQDHTGVLRRVFIRCSSSGSDIMVVISINASTIPHRERLVFALRGISSRITSIILNINTAKTNLVLGEKNIRLYGSDTMPDTLCGFMYDISPHSFFQINHEQTERLYMKALEYAALDKTKNVFDLYCGIGTISLCAAERANKVIGVEIVPDAIKNAKENALRNCIENAEFYCAAAEDIVPKLITDGANPDTVILDPPRKGSDPKTLSAILSASPERIVYVSCNPATLARDIRFLTQGGYVLEAVTGVDLFPQTVHVECVVLMSRIEK